MLGDGFANCRSGVSGDGFAKKTVRRTGDGFAKFERGGTAGLSGGMVIGLEDARRAHYALERSGTAIGC